MPRCRGVVALSGTAPYAPGIRRRRTTNGIFCNERVVATVVMVVMVMAMAVVVVAMAMAMTVAVMTVAIAIGMAMAVVVTEAEHHRSRRWMVDPTFLQHRRRTESADIG